MAFGPRMYPEVERVIADLEKQDAAERAQGLPGAQRLQALDHNSARFLYWLALQRAPRLIVEVGTSQGYSTIWLALAARESGGRVITLERRAERAARAREHLAAAGLADLVEVREGLALELLPGVAGPVDFLFIDAEKKEYRAYLEAALPALAPGALVVADNIVSHAGDVTSFLDLLRERGDLASFVLDVDRGLSLSVYRQS